MLCHCDDGYQSMSHLLMTYHGKKSNVKNSTLLPLCVAQIIKYLFGTSIAIVNCDKNTCLKHLIKLISYKSNIKNNNNDDIYQFLNQNDYKEWTKYCAKKNTKNTETKDDENNNNSNNYCIYLLNKLDDNGNNSNDSEVITQTHSLFPTIKHKRKITPLKLKKAVSEPFFGAHYPTEISYSNSDSKNSKSNERKDNVSKVNRKAVPKSNILSKSNAISSQVIILHNVDELSDTMKSIIMQLMKLKKLPRSDGKAYIKSPRNQLIICTRQVGMKLPYLLSDLCLSEYVLTRNDLDGFNIFAKKSMIKNRDDLLLSKKNSLEHGQVTPAHSRSASNNNNNGNDLDNQNIFEISNNDMHVFFTPYLLNDLYVNITKNIFIHNSIKQYIRDIIVAIRLHPDINEACNSLRAYDALLIASKFSSFISKLEYKYMNIKYNESDINKLISIKMFVRPMDVDRSMIEVLSHRIYCNDNMYHNIYHHNMSSKSNNDISFSSKHDNIKEESPYIKKMPLLRANSTKTDYYISKINKKKHRAKVPNILSFKRETKSVPQTPTNKSGNNTKRVKSKANKIDIDPTNPFGDGIDSDDDQKSDNDMNNNDNNDDYFEYYFENEFNNNSNEFMNNDDDFQNEQNKYYNENRYDFSYLKNNLNNTNNNSNNNNNNNDNNSNNNNNNNG